MRGRTALIAGGTGGLGVAVAQAAVARGAIVTVTYVVDAELEPARAAVGPGATFVKADVRSEAEVRALVDALPRLDILIQLVGGFAMSPTPETALDAFCAQLDINTVSTFVLCKHALAKMTAGGYGRIVTVGSRTAAQPTGGAAAYAASKAGVIAITQAIADETRGTAITANCVLPSIIDTPANRRAMPNADPARWVKPESLAEVICFLASEAARDVRGAALPVYGSA